MWQLLKISNVSNTLILKHIFWKSQTFFRKMEDRFLAESAEIENAAFPYKTALSQANVKKNIMEGTKWTYHEERSFSSNFFIFFKNFVSFRTS